MTCLATALLAVLSVWDYPQRQAAHEALKAEYVSAIGAKSADEALYVCGKGVELLPDDPVWRYNLACALAKSGETDDALDELSKAVRLGFRDAKAIAGDVDFASVAGTDRFKEIVEDARESADKPLFMGPNAQIAAEGTIGSALVLGEQNLVWDLENAWFAPKIEMTGDDSLPYAGAFYFNRDDGHSVLNIKEYPGLTSVSLDFIGRERGMGLDFPNMAFPNPVFGNCSRALTSGPVWRSLPRALTTTESRRMAQMHKFYLSNQVWVFPAVDDAGPGAKYGDIFASAAPYWIATEGRSWSDQPYLKAALAVYGALAPEARREIVSRGLLAPTVQALVRKSLKGVESESDYLLQKAHPTAFPKDGLVLARLKALAASIGATNIPPVAPISAVVAGKPEKPVPPGPPEITYITPFAWAFVLRDGGEIRRFGISAGRKGCEIAFAKIHGAMGAAEITNTAPGKAVVTLHKSEMTPACRVDIGVFARTPGSLWGAPSIISFAVVDPDAPYSDPALTPPKEIKDEDGEKGKTGQAAEGDGTEAET